MQYKSVVQRQCEMVQIIALAQNRYPKHLSCLTCPVQSVLCARGKCRVTPQRLAGHRHGTCNSRVGSSLDIQQMANAVSCTVLYCTVRGERNHSTNGKWQSANGKVQLFDSRHASLHQLVPTAAFVGFVSKMNVNSPTLAIRRSR